MSVRLFFYGSSEKKRYVPMEHIVISRQFRRLEQSKWRKQPIKMPHKKRKLPTIADENTYSFGKCFLI